jgi:polysaccharide pyruvyl transferase WcaK-like protein
MKKNPKILLIGIGGVYNYGCEAIVRGTERILHSAWPNAKIIYASPRPEDDQRRLSACDIEVIYREPRERYSFNNIRRKLLSLIHVNWPTTIFSLKLIKNIDIVLSIGGDIYTLGPNGQFYTVLPFFGDTVMRKKIPYVLWGASIGPFSDEPDAERYYTKHLEKVTLITAREKATIEYLNNLGITKNVVPCADPAYVVASEIKAMQKPVIDNVPTIGINLSPFSINFSNYAPEESLFLQVRSIEHLIQSFNAKIVLLPHVVCESEEADDDRRYLRKIFQAIEQEYKKNVILVDEDLGFVGTKKELAKCDVVIAARMHCAINALAATVPTILVSYSKKSIGMTDYVYGDNEWVISIDAFTNKSALENKVNKMLIHKSDIQKQLQKRIIEIKSEAYSSLNSLSNLIK